MDNYKKERKYLLKYFSTVDEFYGVIINQKIKLLCQY